MSIPIWCLFSLLSAILKDFRLFMPSINLQNHCLMFLLQPFTLKQVNKRMKTRSEAFSVLVSDTLDLSMDGRTDGWMDG